MNGLFNKLNIDVKDMSLYETAFTHTSYANEHDKVSYEKLEFLGDSIVDMIISEYLYNKDLEEGQMTKIRASYVCENALARYAKDLNFDKYLLLGRGESNNKAKKDSILADIFEAFIAALYLDQGFDKTKEVVTSIIIPYIEDEVMFFDDYKSKLQEVVQDLQKDLVYEQIDEKGPAHDKNFTFVVKIDDVVYGKGEGHSKKEAEQGAAKSALEKLINK